MPQPMPLQFRTDKAARPLQKDRSPSGQLPSQKGRSRNGQVPPRKSRKPIGELPPQDGRSPIGELPYDVLSMIPHHLYRWDMKKLRLVSKGFASIVTPLLFSRVRLDTTWEEVTPSKRRQPPLDRWKAGTVQWTALDKLVECTASPLDRHVKALDLKLRGDVHSARPINHTGQAWKDISRSLESLDELTFSPACSDDHQQRLLRASLQHSMLILQAAKNITSLQVRLPMGRSGTFQEILQNTSFQQLRRFCMWNFAMTKDDFSALVLQHAPALEQLDLRLVSIEPLLDRTTLGIRSLRDEWIQCLTHLLTSANLRKCTIMSKKEHEGELVAFKQVFGERVEKVKLFRGIGGPDCLMLSWKKLDDEKEP